MPNAEEHQLKAAVVVQLRRLRAEREITQTEGAKLVNLKKPDLSKVLRDISSWFSGRADAYASGVRPRR
nr:XRE family transcriptional regulator [Bradyrhizobium manausense]